MDTVLEWKGSKVLVPGGGGFVGSQIVALLEAKGAEVVVPRQEDGYDFRKREDCQRVMQEVSPTMVINCAAIQGGIGYHKGKEADLFLDNIEMGLFLMEAAAKANVSKFVNVVAGCSYPGYHEKAELVESEYWDGEVHDSIYGYGVARKVSVAYGKVLSKQYNFNSIHLIMANMYGPGEHFNPEQSKALAGLIKKFYEAKKNNVPEVSVWGTGKPVRDWLFVKDGAEGIVLAAERYDSIDPLNIGSGVGISVADLAKLIQGIVGYEGKIVFDTTKQDGAMKKIFSIDRMKEKLQWVPTTTLEEGIKLTVEWFDKNYEYAITH